MQAKANDNFDFKLIEKFSGYNSASDKTNLDPSFLVRGSKNVYKKLSGTLASRPGIKRRGAVDATDASVKSSFEWETSRGTLIPLRVANGKLQFESDIVEADTFLWYDLLSGLTLTRFVFDTWWEDNQKKDRLIMVNGDTTMKHWSGAIALLASVATHLNSVTPTIFSSVTIDAAGTGYAVGDIIEITGGGGTGATLYVGALSGSGIVTAGLINPGSGYTAGSNLATTAVTGAGSGATVTIVSTTTTYSITAQGNQTLAQLGFDITYYGAGLTIGDRKIIINGNEYQYFYGPLDSQTAYGITVDPTGEAVGSVVYQKINTQEDAPVADYTSDFLKTIGNQVIVGSYTSRILYISAAFVVNSSFNGFLDFENNGSFVSGDPDSITLDDLPKGVGEKDGKAVVFGGASNLYLVTLNDIPPVSFTDSLAGVSRFIVTKVEKKPGPTNSAALAHEFIGNFGDSLVWVDQKNQLRALSEFTNNASVKPILLSLPVKEELSEDDLTGGHLRAVDDVIYITAPNNGRDWMYVIRETVDETGSIISEKFWNAPQIRGVSRIAVIDGVTFGHSNVNPQMYQLWDTDQWFDDGPSQENIPYTCVARFAYRQHGRRQGMVVFDNIYYEGYMTQGLELLANLYFDYQGSTSVLATIISDDESLANFKIGTVASSFGDSSFGDNPFGDGILPEGGNQDTLPKFRAIVGNAQVNCFEYLIEVYSTQSDSRWELLCLGANARLAAQMPTFIRK